MLGRYPFLRLAIALFLAGLFFLGSIIWTQQKQPEPPRIPIPEKPSGEEAESPASIPDISISEKKQLFIDQLLPAIEEVYQELSEQYQQASKLIASDPDNSRLQQLRKSYQVNNNDKLLKALKPHPVSIALAQAAMESSWATSRFFEEANNAYGIWSFNSEEPRLAAGEKRGEKTIWVKKYASLQDSVRDYYRTLARGAAYREFRNLNMTSDDPYQLVKKLHRYSEKKDEYGKELAQIIRYNDFARFDSKTVEQPSAKQVVKAKASTPDPAGIVPTEVKLAPEAQPLPPAQPKKPVVAQKPESTATKDSMTDTTPAARPEATPDTTPDAAPDAVANIVPDVVADVVPDVVADVVPDVADDVAAETVMPDSVADEQSAPATKEIVLPQKVESPAAQVSIKTKQGGQQSSFFIDRSSSEKALLDQEKRIDSSQ